MDIPDEAWAAIRNGSYCSEAGAVELAAPHIARAAQVAILREMSDELVSLLDSLRGERWQGRRRGLAEAEGMVRYRISLLEAGAGQAQVRDGDERKN